MCTNRVFVLIFEVVISVVGLQFFVLVSILKRDIIPIFIYFITFIHTHRGKGRTTFYIPNASLQSCISFIVRLVLG